MNKEQNRSSMWSAVVAALMLVQPLLGLAFQNQYRDVAWIKTAWFGNDWVTLVVAAPALIAGLILARRGSVRGLLLSLGMLGYAVYNGMYYMFAAALNAFLPLYVTMLVLAAIALILALSRLDAAALAARFGPKTPVRIVGGYLVFVGAGLALVWLVMWAAHIFAGQPTPIEPEAFKMVAAIDLSIIVPALLLGGALLWRRKTWGYILAAMASILGAFYLLMLSVNSLIQILLGLSDAPGEVPIWGALFVLTVAAAALLLANVRRG